MGDFRTLENSRTLSHNAEVYVTRTALPQKNDLCGTKATLFRNPLRAYIFSRSFRKQTWRAGAQRGRRGKDKRSALPLNVGRRFFRPFFLYTEDRSEGTSWLSVFFRDRKSDGIFSKPGVTERLHSSRTIHSRKVQARKITASIVTRCSFLESLR